MNQSLMFLHALLAVFPSLVIAAHPVDELAHLTAPPEMAASLGYRLSDCPIAMGTSAEIDLTKVGHRTTSVQFVGMTMWSWHTYALLDSDAGCIVLLTPLLEPLSKTRAEILSMRVNRIGPDGKVIDSAPRGGVHDNQRVESLEDYLPPFAEWPTDKVHPVEALRPLTEPVHKAATFGFRMSDCPLEERSLTRIDLTRVEKPVTWHQRIGDESWVWREFSISLTGETCLVLISPAAGPLRRDHAAILTMVSNGFLPDGERELPEFKIKGGSVVDPKHWNSKAVEMPVVPSPEPE